MHFGVRTLAASHFDTWTILRRRRKINDWKTYVVSYCSMKNLLDTSPVMAKGLAYAQLRRLEDELQDAVLSDDDPSISTLLSAIEHVRAAIDAFERGDDVQGMTIMNDAEAALSKHGH